MKEPKTLLGLSVAVLRASKCYLTYQGAESLYACPEGLRLWRAKRWGKIEARLLFKKFSEMCPSCWASMCLDHLESRPYYLEIKPSDYYFTTVVQDNILCTCDEDYYGHLVADSKAMEKFTLVVRAIIIHAPKYIKKCDEEETND